MNGICLVSLGAKYVTPAAVDAVVAAARARKVRVTFYLLDSLEEVNQRVLNRLAPGAAKDRVAELALKLLRQVSDDTWRESEVFRASELEAQPRFQAWLARVRQAYQGNRSFAHECEAQVYQNLHPRLKRLGIKNRRHPILGELAEYMLLEIALKLHLLEVQPHQAEFGWSEEMPFWRSILNGKYPEFAGLPPAPDFVHVSSAGTSAVKVRTEHIRFGYSAAGKPGIIDLSLTAGGIAAILGPSGSFKTTALKLIAGHLTPDSGRVWIGDRDVTGVPTEARRVVTVFQGFALFPHQSALQNVIEGGRQRTEYTQADLTWLARMHLRRLNVEHCADQPVTSASGGEQQRIAIARALMAEPEVLLMDEPTASIDALQRDSLAKLLRQISEGNSSMVILIVSHDRDFVLGVADELTVMDEGRAIASGKISDLISNPPNARTAMILGTHSVISGELNADSRFVFGTGGHLHLRVPSAPAGLTGPCHVLIPHQAVGILPAGEGTAAVNSTLDGVVTRVVDNGATVTTAVDVDGVELVSVGMKKALAAALLPGALVDVAFDARAILLCSA